MSKGDGKFGSRPEADRRTFFRQNVVVPFDCFREGARVAPHPKPAKVSLSGGGIRFATSQSFRIGDRVEVVLGLPGGSPIHATAEIVQLHPDELDETLHVLSCRFVSMTRRIQERIIRFLLRSQASHIQEAHEARSDEQA
jgi:c-di-GMP-binding flagellar brake protein YcgR